MWVGGWVGWVGGVGGWGWWVGVVVVGLSLGRCGNVRLESGGRYLYDSFSTYEKSKSVVAIHALKLEGYRED